MADSILKEYYELFADTNPAIDFASIIVDAMLYIYRKNEERYALGRTVPTPPLDLSEMPGTEFGFRPMPLCMSILSPRSRDKDTGALLPRVRKYSELLSGITIQFKDAEAEDPDPGDEVFALYRMGAGTHSAEPSGYIPLLYNETFGEVYYLPAKVRVGKAGRIQMTVRLQMPALAINWVTGRKTIIGCCFSIPYTTGWFLPTPEAFTWLEDTMKRYPDEDKSAHWETELRAADAEEVKTFGHPDGELHVRPYECRRCPMTEEEFRKYHTKPYMDDFKPDNFGLYGFLEKLYALPRCALWETTRYISTTSSMGMAPYYAALKAFQNMFQTVLQTWDKSIWFLPTLLDSLRPGKCVVPDGVTTLPALLGLDKPTYKFLMEKPIPEPFIFFMVMNQHKKTSIKEFERVYANVKHIACDKDIIHYRYRRGDVKTKHGRILFSSYQLPNGFGYYTKHNLKKDISLAHFFKWLRQEVDIYRDAHPVLPAGALSPSAAVMNLMDDYNRMARELFPHLPRTFPHNIERAHDVMVENYNRVKADKMDTVTIKDEEYMRFAQCYKNKRCDVYMDERYLVMAPACSMDLYEEGIILNHCVGAYGNDIMKAKGSMLIYFLRSVKDPDTPLVTIQVDKKPGDSFYALTEVAGKGNRLPSTAESEFCDRWLVEFNAAYEKAVKEEKEMPTDYDPETLLWARTHGIPDTMLPSFQVSYSLATNYERLWLTVLDIETGKAAAERKELDIEPFRKSIAYFCTKVGLDTAFYKGLFAKVEARLAA